ncbi:MAG TPA: alpha-amylase family glycosyl hydrolase [Gemmatimonadaceae bacterium]|jgi:glycosidase|nr:alpha-amylase family glycosyl hydrolase [Gemmatimonadaceae bacterium]
MKSRLWLFIGATPLLAGCRSAASTAASPTSAAPSWSRSAVLYEVNVRQYTPEGTFAALDRRLPHLDSLGVDVLWIMPVQPIGKLNRKGALGSYYSVSDYKAFNPEFGSAADFRGFVNDAHRRGKRVVLDWVPNHTSFDHVWVTRHPDWYVHRPDGSISNARDNENHETDWTDVAELDYDKPAMRREMIADMRWWLDSMSIDGFRCDVAGGVPMDFWREARRALTAVKPDLFMLAEAEGPQYYPAFDATYGWELHHLLNEIAQGKRAATELDAYFARQRRDYPRTAYRMYFTSNHDENSWNGSEFERMGENHQPAFILAATAQLGIPLIYSGQEASLRKRLRFFEKDTVDWSGTSLVGFYRSVVDLKHGNGALWNGAEGGDQVTLETDGGNRIYAFTRTRGENTVLVALNFGDAPAHISYTGLSHTGQFSDWFSKARVTLGSLGTIDVPAHGYRVLVR